MPRFRPPSVHMWGPEKLGGGNRRTLCEQFMAEGPQASIVSEGWESVTCRGCLKRRKA